MIITMKLLLNVHAYIFVRSFFFFLDDVEYSVSLEDWSDDDEEKLDDEDQKSINVRRPIPHLRPDRGLVSGITNDEIEEITTRRDESYPLQRNIDPQDNWMDSRDVTSHEGMDNNDNKKSDIATLEMRAPSQNSCDERSHVSSSPSFMSAPRSHIRPPLPEPTLQEEAANCRIEAETFAELGGSNSSRLHSPRTYRAVRLLQKEEPASVLSIFESENGSSELEQKSAGPCQSRHVSSRRNINSTPQEDHPSSSSAQPAAKASTYGRRRHHRPSKTSHTDLNDVRWVCVCV